MEKLTRHEKQLARRLNVSANDLYFDGRNSCGAVYGLYNNYYLIRGTFDGYSKPEIYRALLRKLIEVDLSPAGRGYSFQE